MPLVGMGPLCVMRYGANYRQLMSAGLRKAEREYVRADDGKFSEGAGGGGGSKGQPKEEAPKERAPSEERAAALTAAGLDPATAEAFDELATGIADGEDIALSPEAKQALIDAGLVTPREGSDWAVDLTDKGKAVAEAAATGDGAGAKAAMDGGKAAPKEDPAAAPKEEPKTPAASLSVKPKGEGEGEKKKPKGGGGGGGGGSDKEQARADKTASAVGLSQNDMAALRTGEPSEALRAAGLQDESGKLTEQGHKLMAALGEGDRAAALAILGKEDPKATREKARQAKEKARQAREREKERLAAARLRREREMLSPWLQEKKLLKRAGLPYGFGAYSRIRGKVAS